MRRVALITGGGRGIGFGIAQSLAKEEYDLAICGRRDEKELDGPLKSLRESGSQVLYVKADVSEAESRERLAAGVLSRYGRVDVLVNNSGVAPKKRQDILKTTEDSFEWVLKVNLQGPYFLTQAIANQMIKQKALDPDFSGCVINITSISSTVASPNRGEYCISKAGMSMATSLWSVRLAEYDIPVYEVRPGIIKTDMTRAVTAKYDKLIEEGLLLQARWGLPEDVGKACAMLVRGDMPYSTGQVIMVDGGMTVPRLQ